MATTCTQTRPHPHQQPHAFHAKSATVERATLLNATDANQTTMAQFPIPMPLSAVLSHVQITFTRIMRLKLVSSAKTYA